MVVTIKERQFEFNSDFPEGWQFSKGDYFKFPVEFGINKCFIKRFKTRTPESISGWALLLKLKGRYAANLPRIHDIQHTTEQGADIYYVFYEFIDGNTLHHLRNEHADVNLYRLTDDVLHALQSMHKNSYWFSDFDERNIFCNQRGLFYLVDVDSAQPVSARPDIEMWGNKDYWVLVFNFYKSVLGHNTFVPSNIEGAVLNYLQVIFLVLRLKIYYSDPERDYGDIFNELPVFLDSISPTFRNLFQNLFNQQQVTADTPDEVAQLIKQAIIPLTQEEVAGALSGKYADKPQPVINSFTLHHYAEKNGDEFLVIRDSTYLLRWDVVNAGNVELYEDDVLLRRFTSNETSITITETPYKPVVEYTLLVSEGPHKVQSGPIRINFQYNDPVIHEFIVAGYHSREGAVYFVEHDLPFELQWKVDYASEVSIYRNGGLWKTVTGESSVSLLENYHSDEPVNFELLAINPEGKTVRDALTLKVENPAPVISNFNFQGKAGGEKNHVAAGEEFTIGWLVNKAEKVVLRRNGVFYKDLPASGQLQLTEQLRDGREHSVEYVLVATNRGISVVSNPLLVEVVIEAPVIFEFRSVHNSVKPGGIISLSWQVNHLEKLELYRNGLLLIEPLPGSNTIDLPVNETYQEDSTCEFILSALNGSKRTDSKPVMVSVDKVAKPVSKKYLQGAALFALLLLIIFVGYRMLNTTPIASPVIASVLPEIVYEDSVLTITGSGLPASAEVRFNNQPGKINSSSSKQLIVGVPHLAGRNAPESIEVQITDKSKVIYRTNMAYLAKTSNEMPATLPGYLNEVWTGENGLFLSFDLKNQLVHFATTDKQKYFSEKIQTYQFDKGAQAYRITTKMTKGFRAILLKDLSSTGYQAAVCSNIMPDSMAANNTACGEFQAMSVYYDIKPNLIYLPAQPGAASILNNSENSKLQAVTANGNVIKSVTLFHASRYLPAPDPIAVRQLLKLPAEVSIITAPAAHLSTSSPFQRNFALVTIGAGKAEQPTVVTADCKRIFHSIAETKSVPNPLVICKLDLSGEVLTSIPAAVFSFRNLKWLNLGSNKIKKAQLIYLRKTLPECKVVQAKSIEPASTVPPAEKAGRTDFGYIHFTASHVLDADSRVRLNKLARQLRDDPNAKLEMTSNWNYGKPDDSILAAHITYLKGQLKSLGIPLTSKQIDIKLSADKNLKKDVNSFHLSGINF